VKVGLHLRGQGGDLDREQDVVGAERGAKPAVGQARQPLEPPSEASRERDDLLFLPSCLGFRWWGSGK
jgi:hypothetical protein